MLYLQSESGAMGSSFIVMMGLVMVVFYLFMVLPQNRRNKKQKNYRESLKKGDRIITTGGIHGKIVEVKGDAFLLELETATKIKIEKTAINMELSMAKYKPKEA
ncbi:MAG: preprotein translocase subunit YajC [Bacteroidetes bacterium MED-G17]|nr:MAG: preprotein translocase subunit YajC [Bacteroidetes bacterium TMED39]PDH53500.1 MAG: preprotein translocase subunit YajC [Bacteroidetes bacterium MED-G17]CAI8359364.1 MAG: Uncharacterised protein [Bacteroidetes bacterium MED-G17]|tara:strand:- start:9462 stop:9773 length:312 start_codon:yes stop_codon:yes gene_type:complete